MHQLCVIFTLLHKYINNKIYNVGVKIKLDIWEFDLPAHAKEVGLFLFIKIGMDPPTF